MLFLLFNTRRIVLLCSGRSGLPVTEMIVYFWSGMHLFCIDPSLYTLQTVTA